MSGKKKTPPMIRIHCFKKKEKDRFEGRSQLNGQWKVLMFSGPWKEKEKEKHLFTSSHFSPTNFT
jgi:hypothetical protein